MRAFISIAVLFALSGAVHAQEVATIESMQMPAWLVTGGDIVALRPDSTIQSGDEIITGDSGRVLAYMPDGSDLKLGSGARFIVHRLERVEEQIEQAVEAAGQAAAEVTEQATEEVVNGLFEIPKGAFRYTTRAALKYLKRSISVKVGFSTVGIRGTDFWGKADSALDTVCLIEGAIAIEKQGQIVEMDDPLTFYRAPVNGPPEPVAPVDSDLLAQWAASVDIEPGSGVLSADGSWSVYLGSYRAEQNAENLSARLDAEGYSAQIVRAQSGGTLYRVGVLGFVSRADANWFVNWASEELGIQGAWASQG